MKIPFRRITTQSKEIDYCLDGKNFNISINANILKKSTYFVELNGALRGYIELECDSCLGSFKKNIEEKISFRITDKLFKNNSSLDDEKDYDIIEFLDGIIDFNEIIISEVSSIELDYHKCIKCKHKEN